MKLKKKLAISDTGFVFDPHSGESFSLNETGTEILNMLKEGKSQEEIMTHFLENYEVDNDTFERAYMDFIAMLKFYNISEENEKD
ncbi:MAG: HPr-rel-A system PqqD family protein [Bacteroidetes bacterium HGW-Bacteroidetes-21]|jgi:PqqD family protein of HPr-rel-A system|nr:MAG: HPr-rel-A system PqqD family protein [Bacteroidetes bacterium HGW-Bacteroidetes-21]